MKHKGTAAKANLRILALALVGALAVLGLGLAMLPSRAAFVVFASIGLGLYALFVVFCFNFFRDPDPNPPSDIRAIVASGHGKVDFVGEITEPEVMGGPCKRVSIFLSVFDVHVQNAPLGGTVTLVKHTPGQFLNALNPESAIRNENVLIGFASKHRPGEKIGIRLIAGLIARRIVPWVKVGDSVECGERISLIQFGSRVDLYLPLTAKVLVKPGDRAVGGETVLAECG